MATKEGENFPITETCPEQGLTYYADSRPNPEHPERNDDLIYFDAKTGLAMILHGHTTIQPHFGKTGQESAQLAKDILVGKLQEISPTNDPGLISIKLDKLMDETSQQLWRQAAGMAHVSVSLVKLMPFNKYIVAAYATYTGLGGIYRYNRDNLAAIGELTDEDIYSLHQPTRRNPELVRVLREYLAQIKTHKDRKALPGYAQEEWEKRHLGEAYLGDYYPPNFRVIPSFSIQKGDRLAIVSPGIKFNLTTSGIYKAISAEDPAHTLVERAYAVAINKTNVRSIPTDISAIVLVNN